MCTQSGVHLLIVDYLQLLKADPAAPVENREQEITVVAQALKALAMEVRIPVIVLSQLNRDLARSDCRRMPRLSDLRESGAIEDAADIVALLYRPETDYDNFTETSSIPTNLLIAKNRNGATGQASLTFVPDFARFEQAADLTDVPVDKSEASLSDNLGHVWKAALDPDLVSHSTPTAINKGTLFVSVDGQHWLNAAIRRRGQILAQLKNRLGECANLVERISFRLEPAS